MPQQQPDWFAERGIQTAPSAGDDWFANHGITPTRQPDFRSANATDDAGTPVVRGPELRASIGEQLLSKGQQIARTPYDLTVGGLKGAGSTVFGMGKMVRDYTPVGRAVDKVAPGLFDRKPAMLEPSNTTQRVGYGLEQVGEFFVPTGIVGKAAKVAEIAKAGGLSLAQSGDPMTAGVSAGLTAVVPGGRALARVGGVFKGSAEKSMAQALGATKEWAKADAAKLAPQMLQRGVKGSRTAMLAEAKDMAKVAGQGIEDAIKAASAAGTTIPTTLTRGHLQLTADAFMVKGAQGQMVPIEGAQGVVKKLLDLDTFLEKLGPDIPIAEAQIIKQAWGKIVSKAGLFGPKATASATDNAEAWAIREAERSFAEQLASASPNLQKMKREFAFWGGLRNVLKETQKRTQAQAPSLLATLGAGPGAIVGAVTGGPLGAGTGAVIAPMLVKLVQSPSWRTRVSGPSKQLLAEALASGSTQRVAEAAKKVIASIPPALRPAVAAGSASTVPPMLRKEARADEGPFQHWYADMAQRHSLNPDPDAPEQQYDYRAAFRANAKPDASGHWPSDFKQPGHPNMVVGGFHVQTGERVPGTPQASEAELIQLGWPPETAARLSRGVKPQSKQETPPDVYAAAKKATSIGPPSRGGERQIEESEFLARNKSLIDITRDVGLLPDPLDAAPGAQMASAGMNLVKRGGGGLYSRLERAIDTLPNMAHPSKVLSVAKNAASSEEIAWRGLPEWLASKGNQPVAKAEIQQFLSERPIDVGMTRLGTTVAKPMPEGYRVEPLAKRSGTIGVQKNYTLIGPDGTGRAFHAESADDAEMMAREILGLNSKTPTKFGQYQVPGGEAYRETLITLPTKGEKPVVEYLSYEDWLQREITPDAQHGAANDAINRRVYAADKARAQADSDSAFYARQREQAFRGGHFDEPNVVAHARTNERTLPTGEKGRFLEEVQSDWHQKGKKEGYGPGGAARAQLEAESRAAQDAWQRASRDVMDKLEQLKKHGQRDASFSTNAAAYDASKAHLSEVAARAKDLEQRLVSTVPDAPFKESWPELALKQQLLEVAERPDLDWIGFTSGQTQAARYDLSKQIDRLKVLEGNFEEVAGKGYQVTAWKNGNELISKRVSESELPGLIGKEMADRARKDLDAAKQRPVPKYATEYTGLDLQVGGEGMTAFYDRLLPKRLEKIVKPFGGKVERVPMGKTPLIHEQVPFGGDVKDQAWIVRLTPEMKQRILKEGLPLMTAALAVDAATRDRKLPPPLRNREARK